MVNLIVQPTKIAAFVGWTIKLTTSLGVSYQVTFSKNGKQNDLRHRIRTILCLKSFRLPFFKKVTSYDTPKEVVNLIVQSSKLVIFEDGTIKLTTYS